MYTVLGWVERGSLMTAGAGFHTWYAIWRLNRLIWQASLCCRGWGCWCWRRATKWQPDRHIVALCIARIQKDSDGSMLKCNWKIDEAGGEMGKQWLKKRTTMGQPVAGWKSCKWHILEEGWINALLKFISKKKNGFLFRQRNSFFSLSFVPSDCLETFEAFFYAFGSIIILFLNRKDLLNKNISRISSISLLFVIRIENIWVPQMRRWQIQKDFF